MYSSPEGTLFSASQLLNSNEESQQSPYNTQLPSHLQRLVVDIVSSAFWLQNSQVVQLLKAVFP